MNSATANIVISPNLSLVVNTPTICSGQTTTLTSTGATTYTWSNGTIGNSIVVSPSSTTSFSVSGTNSTCSGSTITTVVVNPLPSLTVNSSTICVGQTTTLTASGATTYLWNTGSLSNTLLDSPISNTTYTVIGTTLGCTNTAVANVSVTPLPTVTVNSSTICSGQTATITASGANTYTWNTSSFINPLTISPTSSTTFSVIGTANGCSSTSIANVFVTPNPTISVNSATICNGTSATLIANGASNYSWSTGSSSNTLTASPSLNTAYTVTGTTSGCTNTAVANISVRPLPIVTVNSSTICLGQTTSLTASGATTYLWNTGSLSDTLVGSPISNTTYTVMGTTLGCTNTAVASISVTPLPTVTVNSTNICSGQTATINASGANTYTWNTGSSINPLTISPTSSTTFSVIGTTNGCSSTSTANIFVTPNPTISVNSVVICNGTSATLTANGASTYVWSTGTTSNTLTASPSLNTTYTVTGTASGCTNTGIANVSVTPLPTVTVNSSTICSGTTATLIANGANTYSWSTGITGNQLTISPTTITVYSVTGTNASCSNTASAIVNVISSPILSVSSPTICAGQTATLAVSGANSYIWNNGQTTNTTAVNPIITTTYSVSGTNGICNSTTTVNVIVNQLPILTATSKTICAGQSATLIANGALSYNWSNSSFANSLAVSPNATTIYTVTGTNSNCSSSTTASVVVNSIPNISINSDKTFGCAPLCIQFNDLTTVASSTITNWSWAFDDGFSSNLQNPSHCFDNPGTYNISLLVTASNGCSKMFTNPNMINVFPNPIAEFVSSASETDILNPIIDFTNLSSNANTYKWNFGITTSTLTNPSHTYAQEGTYSTTLTATNQYGCKDIMIHDIVVKGIFTFYAPNTFTPNEDNINDIFLPLGVGWDLDNYQLDIFDRWGNNCFNTNDVGKGWDGKANHGNESAQIDTYTWKVDLKDIFGKNHKYIGKVVIIR